MMAAWPCFVEGEPGSELIVGEGPYNPAAERIPLVLNRRRAQCTTYVTLFHPYRGASRVQSVTWLPQQEGDLASLTVERAATKESWRVSMSPSGEVEVEIFEEEDFGGLKA